MRSKLLAAAAVVTLWTAVGLPAEAQQPPATCTATSRLVPAQPDAGTEFRRLPRKAEQLRLSPMVMECVSVADPECQRRAAL